MIRFVRVIFWVFLGFLAGYLVFGVGLFGYGSRRVLRGGFWGDTVRRVLVDVVPVRERLEVPRFGVGGLVISDSVFCIDTVLRVDTVFVVDTGAVVRDYYVRRDYELSFGDDSVGVFDFRGSVWQNRLVDVSGTVVPRVRVEGVVGPAVRPFVFGGFGDGLGYGLVGVEFRGGLMVGGGGYGGSGGGGYLVGCGWRF